MRSEALRRVHQDADSSGAPGPRRMRLKNVSTKRQPSNTYTEVTSTVANTPWARGPASTAVRVFPQALHGGKFHRLQVRDLLCTDMARGG